MQTTQPRRRPPTISTPVPAVHDTELVDHLDELLDEIDALLEEEDTFLLNYRQKGGQ